MFGNLKASPSSHEPVTFGSDVAHNGSAGPDQRGPDQRGLVRRCLGYIFAHFNQRLKARHGKEDFVCSAQFLEVYQEQVHDLLDPSCPVLKVRESIEKGVWADGAVEENINDAAAAEALLQRGEKHRHTAATAMNHVSSRSHAVFTLKVTARQTDDEDDGSKTLMARFNLVDLAGSERQLDTLAEGARLKEASGINKSLSNLGLVIQALVDQAHGKQRHIHYRDAKITFLLRDSLGGNSKTTMLCCVSPSEHNFGETLSCLRFAQRAKEIPTHAQVNSEYTLADVHKLKAAIRVLKTENVNLKAALSRRDRLSERSLGLLSYEGPQSNSRSVSEGRDEMVTGQTTREDVTDRDETRSVHVGKAHNASFSLGIFGALAERLDAYEVAHSTDSHGDGNRAPATLMADLRSILAQTNGLGGGQAVTKRASLQAKLEGAVSRLEVEKIAMEDNYDALEAKCQALSNDCADLMSQASYARVKQKEAEAKAADALTSKKSEAVTKALKLQIEVCCNSK